jgi:hypothetical protein
MAAVRRLDAWAARAESTLRRWSNLGGRPQIKETTLRAKDQDSPPGCLDAEMLPLKRNTTGGGQVQINHHSRDYHQQEYRVLKSIYNSILPLIIVFVLDRYLGVWRS